MSSPEGSSADSDVTIPRDLCLALGRFFDALKLRIVQGAVQRAELGSGGSDRTSVRPEDVVDAATMVFPHAAEDLESSLRQINPEDVRRRAS